ncbi:DMT family transporter [Amphibiibacter pelophylacis]|uniref:DMT family transporter n=1 Tax=Amphibiibacter pelophylacis TaxID=1799477 RepID=A0ACC6P3I1_9BURK
MTRWQSNAVLTFVCLIWGSAFVGQAWGMSSLGPLWFTGIRFLMGAATITPLVWLELRRVARREGLEPTRQRLRHGLGLGVLVWLGACLQQAGIVHTSVTHAGFLTTLYVPLVPLLVWMLFRQRPHWSVWPTMVASLIGLWLLTGEVNLTQLNPGDALVLASVIPWALHVVMVGHWAGHSQRPLLLAWLQFVVCGLLSMATGAVLEPVSWSGVQTAMGALLYTGVLSVGVGYTLQVVVQRHTQATDAAIILTSETLFAALAGAIFMGDRLGLAAWAGCGLILLGVVAVQLVPLLERQRPNAPPPTADQAPEVPPAHP